MARTRRRKAKKRNLRKKKLKNRRVTVKKYRKYERDLIRLQRAMAERIQELLAIELLPEVEMAAREYKQEQQDLRQLRRDQIDTARLREIINRVKSRFFVEWSDERLRRELNLEFLFLSNEVDADLQKQVLSSLNESPSAASLRAQAPRFLGAAPIGLTEMVQQSVQSSANAIQKVNEGLFREIEGRVLGAMQSGDRWENLVKDLKSSAFISTKPDPGSRLKPLSRARLIARNEVTTALSNENKKRQQEAGVQLYRWQTAEDERVRDDHENKNGKIFSWNGEVKVGDKTYSEAKIGAGHGSKTFPSGSNTYPGHEINCRCVALPVLIDEEGDLID